MSEKKSKVIVKPANQKKTASPPRDLAGEKKTKLQGYRYFPGEEPETSSIFSYGRDRTGTVYD